MKKTLSLSFLLALIITGFAQIPAGYYNGTDGLAGNDLRYKLRTIIDNHTIISYKSLWKAYKYTDEYSNGKIWDIYSNCSFTYSSDQCGSYVNVCDCYNREHTVPKSWFGEASPMVSDLFQVLPTDGKVNGERSNYPYGECSSGTSWGTGKKGSCTYPGFSGTVFEPADEYKGDLARIYFYMVTRYNVTGWHQDPEHHSNDVFSGDAFTSWTLNMLLDWNDQDPVSQKEIDRNNVIYNNYQHNRNPYVDHPEWVCAVFGSNCNASINTPDNFTNITVSPNPFVENLNISYNLIENSDVQIRILSVNGEVIDIINQKSQYTGNNDFTWNASNFNLTNGIYFVQIISNKQISTQKVVYLNR